MDHNSVNTLPTSVADPDLDPLGSEPFCRIRIRSNCPDPDPTLKSHKTYKKYNRLNRYRIFVI